MTHRGVYNNLQGVVACSPFHKICFTYPLLCTYWVEHHLLPYTSKGMQTRHVWVGVCFIDSLLKNDYRLQICGNEQSSSKWAVHVKVCTCAELNTTSFTDIFAHVWWMPGCHTFFYMIDVASNRLERLYTLSSPCMIHHRFCLQSLCTFIVHGDTFPCVATNSCCITCICRVREQL